MDLPRSRMGHVPGEGICGDKRYEGNFDRTKKDYQKTYHKVLNKTWKQEGCVEEGDEN